jgi:hypothetical protein
VQQGELRSRRMNAAWTTRILALAAFVIVVIVLLITLASK